MKSPAIKKEKLIKYCIVRKKGLYIINGEIVELRTSIFSFVNIHFPPIVSIYIFSTYGNVVECLR